MTSLSRSAPSSDSPGSAIVLIGPMGAGKTSIGRRVARALGVPFADTDKLITRDHGAIPALFERHGEAHFRALEREAVRSVRSPRAGVVALGGERSWMPRPAPISPRTGWCS